MGEPTHIYPPGSFQKGKSIQYIQNYGVHIGFTCPTGWTPSQLSRRTARYAQLPARCILTITFTHCNCF